MIRKRRRGSDVAVGASYSFSNGEPIGEPIGKPLNELCRSAVATDE